MKICSSGFLSSVAAALSWLNLVNLFLCISFSNCSLSQYLQLVCTEKHLLSYCLWLRMKEQTQCPRQISENLILLGTSSLCFPLFPVSKPSFCILRAFDSSINKTRGEATQPSLKMIWSWRHFLNKREREEQHPIWANSNLATPTGGSNVFRFTVQTCRILFLNSLGADIMCQAEFWVHGNKSDAKLQWAAATSW